MYSVELKIKRKSLAYESRIIRQEEIKCKEDARSARIKQKLARANAKAATFDSLYLHRRYVVRPEARAANIAHGFLRNVPYQEIERIFYKSSYGYDNQSSRSENVLWDRIVNIVAKFGGMDFVDAKNKVLAWRNKHPLFTTDISGMSHGLDDSLKPKKPKKSKEKQKEAA